MKTGICTALSLVLPVLMQAQILDGDPRFPLVSQIRWDMNRTNIVSLCTAGKVSVGGNDSTVTFDTSVLGVPATAMVRLMKESDRPRQVEIRFKEWPESLPDSLVTHFTRATGRPPARVEKEKSVLLFTIRMEVAVWKTPREKINLIVAKRNGSTYDVYLSILPPV